MQQESRVKKSLLNARVNLIFYFLSLALSFFSRKIFLDSLGADFVGLSGTLGNILGFLSLAEMGVGIAVSYHLYKPIQEGNKEQINELVSVFGYLYQKIGIFIGLGGVIISLFIPLIFSNSGFEIGLIYFAFYAILVSSLFSYFINYRQILLSADQRGYVVTVYLQGAAYVKIFLQMAVAYYLNNYYLWIMLEVLFGVISCIILNWKIRTTYPWLNATASKGKQAFSKHKSIVTYTKQIFVHKIKDFLLMQSDQILVFAFVSLKMVAYYGNYTLITSKLTQLFNTFMGSVWASVGNLVAEGNKKKILQVFWEIQSIYFLIAGLVVFSIYHFIDSFICLWLGEEYILNETILILLLINVFIMLIRNTVDMFNGAYGHFADTWSAWAEGISNIAITLLLAPFMGVSGILIGKIVSLVLFVILWKPYYLFHKGLHLSVKRYWIYTIRYLGLFVISFYLGHWFYLFIPIDDSTSFMAWFGKVIFSLLPFTLIYYMSMYLYGNGMKDITIRFLIKLKVLK